MKIQFVTYKEDKDGKDKFFAVTDVPEKPICLGKGFCCENRRCDSLAWTETTFPQAIESSNIPFGDEEQVFIKLVVWFKEANDMSPMIMVDEWTPERGKLYSVELEGEIAVWCYYHDKYVSNWCTWCGFGTSKSKDCRQVYRLKKKSDTSNLLPCPRRVGVVVERWLKIVEQTIIEGDYDSRTGENLETISSDLKQFLRSESKEQTKYKMPTNFENVLAIEEQPKEETREQYLERLINNPEIENFLEGVKLEAAHQIERWGLEKEERNPPHHYILVMAKILGKMSTDIFDRDVEKFKHHCIAVAAEMHNLHRQIEKEGTQINNWFHPKE